MRNSCRPYVRDWNDFPYVQLANRNIGSITMRGLSLGTVDADTAAEIGCLVVMTAGCWWFAVRRVRGLLIR